MRRPGLCILLGAALLAPATATPALTPPAVDQKTYPLVAVYGYPVYLAAGEARPPAPRDSGRPGQRLVAGQ
jgi:hypothetical protein